MRVDLGIWDKLNRTVVFLLFLAALLAVALWYLPLIRQNEHFRKDILQKEAQIQKEEETLKKLRGSIESLLHDRKAAERLVRENLGYAKPGEIVVRFEPAMTNSLR
jgi:cell division protein FtsB